jgi:transcriptional regulator CtsR
LIEKETGQQVTVSTGKRGQFDVLVDDKVVAKREGNFFSKVILRQGWPEEATVVSAVKAAIAPHN